MNLFIHFAVDRHLSSFRFGTILHGADINTSSGKHKCVFLLDNPRSGIVGFRVCICFLLLIGKNQMTEINASQSAPNTVTSGIWVLPYELGGRQPFSPQHREVPDAWI